MPESSTFLPVQLLTAVMALSACETVADTGFACVVPAEAGCTDRLVYDVSEDEEFGSSFADCAPGALDADTPIAIRVFLGRDPGVSRDLECSADISGDHELTISASFRWRDEINESGVRGLWVDCETPPLAAGRWTLRYGQSGVAQVDVPDSEVPIFCLDSGARP